MSVVDRVFDTTPEHFDQEKYHRSLSLDPQYIPNSVPKERIQWLRDEDQGIFSVWSVDSTIQIRAPADAFRKHKASLQQKINEKETSKGKEGMVYGLVTVIVGMCLRAINRSNAPASYLLSLVGIVASAIFVGFKWNNADKAAKEVQNWNRSPARELANQRSEALKNGFPYAYSNHLKHDQQGSSRGILHPDEVKTMYERYIQGFCRELLSREENHDKGRERWMHDFLHLNPLSANLMNYGLGVIPDRMKAVSEDFKRFDSILQSLKTSFSDLKNQVKDNYAKLITSYEDQRKATLQPLLEKKTVALTNAQNVRDAAFKEHPLETSKEHQNAEATFKTMKNLYENDYKQTTAPMNQYFDQKIEEVKKGRDESLKSLDGQQTYQMLNYYSAARELLTKAECAWNGQAYQPVNFNQYFHWQVPQPVAPPAPMFQYSMR